MVPAKWGLIFNWGATKTSFGQVPKTINCRDDSLLRTSGLWNSVKHQRCIVPAQGFYEWLNTGKEKVSNVTVGRMKEHSRLTGPQCPHYVKPANGTDLFYFAGLWNSHMDAGKTIITFTIITTSSSEQLRFLHDRMPVILCEPDTIRTWLDGSVRWSMDLQKLLKPLGDDACISCYPVAKEVGKVGRSEKRFTEKLEPKAGIASFFKQKDQKKDIGAVKREAADISASEDDPKRLVLETNVPLGVKVEMKDEDKEPVTKVNHEAEPEKEEIDSMHKRARIGSSTEKSPRKISRPSSPSRMKRRPRTANGNQKITSFFFKGPIS